MPDPSVRNIDETTMEVSGSVPADVFDAACKRATNEFISNTELKGFRKGKAPEDLVLRHVGEHVIMERAIQLALSDAWPAIVEEHHIEAIGQPEFQITKVARGNPLEWKAKITVLPDITLPDYRRIAKDTKAREQQEITADDKDIDNALEWMRKAHAKKGADLPVLDDAFAKTVGMESLEKLRGALRENIMAEKRAKERERIRVAILGAIRNASPFPVPSALVTHEQERMVGELRATVERIGNTWEAYLKETGKTQDDLLRDVAEEAERRAAFSLLLQAIAKDAEISASEDEVTARMERMLTAYPEEQRANIDHNRLYEYVYGVAMNDKVFSLLEGDGKTT